LLRIELQRERERLEIERHAVDGDRTDRRVVTTDPQQRQTRGLLAVFFEKVQNDARSLAGELRLRRPPADDVRELERLGACSSGCSDN
jgi:hypothetical protein